MKLLFVSDFIENPNSGAAGSLISIGNSLVSLGHQVDYIWAKPVEERRIKSFNFYRFFELPFVQYRQVKQALQAAQYDAVIISQPHAWYAIRKLKKQYPKLLFINRTHGWEKRIELNTWHIDAVSLSLKNKLIRYISYALVCHCSYLTVKYSDAVICASSSDSGYIKKEYPRFAQNIFYISYGLDDSFIGVDINSKQTTGITKFLYAGQYLVRKGVRDIQEALQKAEGEGKRFTLTLIIHPSSKGAAEKDFAFLGSRLSIISWLSRNDLIELYKQHDVFLMPSYGEGFGKTSLEAMACGLCVIGYKEGALEDFGKNKSNSLLSAIGDAIQFDEDVVYAITSAGDVGKLGRQAHRDVQTQTWKKCGEDTLQLLYILKAKKSVSILG